MYIQRSAADSEPDQAPDDPSLAFSSDLHMGAEARQAAESYLATMAELPVGNPEADAEVPDLSEVDRLALAGLAAAARALETELPPAAAEEFRQRAGSVYARAREAGIIEPQYVTRSEALAAERGARTPLTNSRMGV